MRRIIHFFAARKLLTIILLIVLGFIVFQSVSYRATNGKEAKTFEVKRGDIKSELILAGDISAENKATLIFGTSGNLTYIGVKEGDIISKGHVVAKLDTTELNAAYQKTLADLRSADATVAKIHDSLKGKDASETYTEKETRTIAEVAKDKAYESFVAARKDLRDATLVSPLSGVVTKATPITVGSSISLTNSSYEIVDFNSLYFSVAADQTEVNDIKVGDSAEITLDAYSDNPIQGIVTSIAYTPKSGESETLYEIKIRVPQSISGVIYRLGMTGDAKFILETRNNVLYVDNEFIQSDSKGKYIFKGDKKDKTYIETGLEAEESTEVISGIKEGDLLYD